MDYKEKYEMALEGIQEILGSGEDSIKMSRLQLRLQGIFPELKESEENEDEKIRKAIHIYLDWLDGKKGYAPRGEYTINDMIDWIEKQGKHQKFRDSIQVGDKVTRNEDGVLVNLSQLARVAKPAKNQDVQQETLCGKCRKEQPSHSCQDITALGRCAVEHEQKPADKVEPKFKVGDIIKPKCYNETHSIKAIGERYYILDVDIKIPFRDEDDWELVEQKPSWSEEDEEEVLKELKSVHLKMGELTRNGYGRKWKQAWRLVNAAIESVEDFEVMNIA
jgi:hypothetical protein